jgi:hypothetical protein
MLLGGMFTNSSSPVSNGPFLCVRGVIWMRQQFHE